VADLLASQPRQTHTMLAPFPIGRNSQVSYSLNGASEAIVFLHGYSGDAVKTWMAFPDLTSGDAPFERFDLIFAGYDSIEEPTESCSDRMRELLQALLTQPASSRRPKSIPSSDNGPYSRVLVIAHSMGGVVVRRALLLADEEGFEWTAKVRMVLFAPAHYGARLLNYTDSIMSGLLGKIWAISQYHSPAIEELRPGSPYLADLRESLEKALTKTPKPQHLVALRVIHAHKEKILSFPGKRLAEDPQSIFIDGTHVSLCKPDSVSSRSMQELQAAIAEWT
jgi:pimeloyl-ACP methyl ester carboxylesterase